MKKDISFLFFTIYLTGILFYGCGSEKKYGDEPIVSSTDTVAMANTAPVFSEKLISFIRSIDQTGFTFDTVRMEKYGQYPQLIRPPFYVEEFPFYKVAIQRHTLLRTIAFETNAGQTMSVPDSTVFIKVKQINAYAFFWPGESGTIEDGVIEQWEFNNDAEALSAVNEFDKFNGHAYTNTGSFGCVDGNYFFLFYSRAAQFSYILEDVFNRFISFDAV